MKIAESNVALSSARSYTEKFESSESLNIWFRTDGSSLKSASAGKLDTLELSEVATNKTTASCDKEDGLIKLSDMDKQKINLIERFCRAVLGKSFKFSIAESIRINIPNQESIESLTAVNSESQGLNWSFSYSKIDSYYEAETTDFSASADITMQDGRKINVDLSLLLSREYQTKTMINASGGNALKDPLVVNFDAASAEVTQEKYSFDIDSDGEMDSISFVGQGSGFLAIDKNGDGIVNDGSELFGTQSGDGFADLSAYDEDGNGWIDENDSVFDKLKIWSKDEQGSDVLCAIVDKGLGAIYLGSARTEFSLKNDTNQTDAVIRKSGLFLYENGQAGTIQHLDLVV
ncbi:MAG: hypothetical protein WC900_06150 [Oscillospiraceae bacterium]